MKRPVAILLLMLSASLASPALAESRVVVRPFYGPYADDVRGQVEEDLGKRPRVIVVSSKEADYAADKLGVDANSPDGRKHLAEKLAISAWVEGIVQKHGNMLRATVLVYDGANHERVARTVVTEPNGKALGLALRRKFWKETKEAIGRARPPAQDGASSDDEGSRVAAADSSSDDSSGDEDRDEVQSTSTSTAFLPAFTPKLQGQGENNDASPNAPGARRPRGREALRASLSAGSPFRRLTYSDPVSQALGDYQLAGAPMVDLRAEYYPGTPYTDGVGSWFGLDLRGQFALGLRTVDPDGNEFKSRYDSYHAGARVRVPVGRHSLHAFSGYGIQRFSLKSESRGVASPAPDVDYRMIRSGAGGEFILTDTLTLGAEMAYLQLLSVGEIASNDWFPRSKAGGVEGSVDATYAINSMLFARAFVGYQRFFFDFRTKNGDPLIAGGATDTYLTAGLGAGVRL